MPLVTCTIRLHRYMSFTHRLLPAAETR